MVYLNLRRTALWELNVSMCWASARVCMTQKCRDDHQEVRALQLGRAGEDMALNAQVRSWGSVHSQLLLGSMPGLQPKTWTPSPGSGLGKGSQSPSLPSLPIQVVTPKGQGGHCHLATIEGSKEGRRGLHTCIFVVGKMFGKYSFCPPPAPPPMYLTPQAHSGYLPLRALPYLLSEPCSRLKTGYIRASGLKEAAAFSCAPAPGWD